MSNPLFLVLTLVEAAVLLQNVTGRGGRGGSRGGRGRYGGGSSSGYGGQSRSQYGSSAPSGGGVGGGGSHGGSRPVQTLSTYKVPTGTMGRVYTPGVARSSLARPQVRTPTAIRTQPTRAVYSSTYVAHYSAYSSHRALYRPTYSSYHYYGGGGGPMHARRYGARLVFIPYQVQFADYFNDSTTSDKHNKARDGVPFVSTPEVPIHHFDLCLLARWNRELPFVELPNMALEFLRNDSISGPTISDKSRFFYDFFKSSAEAFVEHNKSSDTFIMPKGKTVIRCIYPLPYNFDPKQESVSAEEPFFTSVRHVINTYSHAAKQPRGSLEDLVGAAVACLPRLKTMNPVCPVDEDSTQKEQFEGQSALDFPSNSSTVLKKRTITCDTTTHAGKEGQLENPEVLPCIDYTLSTQYVMKLHQPRSIFGNPEICRSRLNADLFNCLPAGPFESPGPCKLEHLVAISLFARNFYLCNEDLEHDTVRKIEEKLVQQYGDPNQALRTTRDGQTSAVLLIMMAACLVRYWVRPDF